MFRLFSVSGVGRPQLAALGTSFGAAVLSARRKKSSPSSTRSMLTLSAAPTSRSPRQRGLGVVGCYKVVCRLLTVMFSGVLKE